jgi:hypothetical protein
MASHWVALALTLQGVWLRLLTMQSAEFPWETWLVPILSWLVLMVAARQQSESASPLASPHPWEGEPDFPSPQLGEGPG